MKGLGYRIWGMHRLRMQELFMQEKKSIPSCCGPGQYWAIRQLLAHLNKDYPTCNFPLDLTHAEILNFMLQCQPVSVSHCRQYHQNSSEVQTTDSLAIGVDGRQVDRIRCKLNLANQPNKATNHPTVCSPRRAKHKD